MSDAKTQDPEQALNKRQKIGYWLKFIKTAKKAAEYRHWPDARAAYAEYELGNKTEGEINERIKPGYPIYPSCCWTLEPAYYARPPIIKTRRLYGIEDEIALTMSMISDRLSTHLLKYGNFDESMIAARGDFIHASKATNQVVYKRELDVNGNVIEDTQSVKLMPCLFDEIIHTPHAKTQADITEMAYKFCLDYDEAEAEFNTNLDGSSKGLSLPYKTGKNYGSSEESSGDEKESTERQLEGWECYCKITKTVYWVCEDFKDDFLKTQTDPLGIRDFFPSPPFIFRNKKRKDLYPTPIFKYLQDTANQLHELYERVFRLIKGVNRRCLVYGASSELIKALNSVDSPQYHAMKDIDDILSKGGINNLIQWVPVKELVDAINETMTIEQHFKDNFYEWFGVPDILRGISDPAETATAQEIKSDAANDRFKFDKKQMWDLARDSVEMMFDVALKVYSNEKIAKICGYDYLEMGTPAQPPTPENPQGIPAKPGHKEKFFIALDRLRNDSERIVSIDFETDSTSFRDEAKEIAKQQLLSNTILQGLATLGQIQNPEFTEPAMDLLLSVVNAMGGSSQSEDLIKRAMSALEKRRNNPAPPPPDVEMLKVQVAQQKLELDNQKAVAEAQLKAQENQIKAQDNQAKQQLEQLRITTDAQIKTQGLQIQELLAQIEAQKVQSTTEIKSLEVAIKTQLDQALVRLDEKQLALDHADRAASNQEKMIEEARLSREQNMNLLATLIQTKKEPPPKQEAKAPALPPIHLHLTPGKRTGTIVDETGKKKTITIGGPE